MSVADLPPRLREWVVDASQVTYLRWPNGKPREIGSGARWGVGGCGGRRCVPCASAAVHS